MSSVAGTQCVDRWWQSLDRFIPSQLHKKLGKGTPFSHARVSNEVASQWDNRSRVLYDSVKDTRGQLTQVPKHPLDAVPPPADSILKEVPGAYGAWRGLSSLDLKVCVVQGGV